MLGDDRRHWKGVVLELRMVCRRHVVERMGNIPHTLVKIVLLLSTGLS